MERPDTRRGKLPEIRTDHDTITFVMTVATVASNEGRTPKLVLRCERNGEIYASIRIDVAGQ